MHRLLGELHLTETNDWPTRRRSCFHPSIKDRTPSPEQGLGTSRHNEPRPALAAPRLWQRGPQQAAVYSTYTEGFTTPDLVDAKHCWRRSETSACVTIALAGAKYVLGCIRR